MHPASVFVRVLRGELSANQAEAVLAGREQAPGKPVAPSAASKKAAPKKVAAPKPCRKGPYGVCLTHGQLTTECTQENNSTKGQE